MWNNTDTLFSNLCERERKTTISTDYYYNGERESRSSTRLYFMVCLKMCCFLSTQYSYTKRLLVWFLCNCRCDEIQTSFVFPFSLRKTSVWQLRIRNGSEKLGRFVCVSVYTNILIHAHCYLSLLSKHQSKAFLSYQNANHVDDWLHETKCKRQSSSTCYGTR